MGAHVAPGKALPHVLRTRIASRRLRHPQAGCRRGQPLLRVAGQRSHARGGRRRPERAVRPGHPHLRRPAEALEARAHRHRRRGQGAPAPHARAAPLHRRHHRSCARRLPGLPAPGLVPGRNHLPSGQHGRPCFGGGLDVRDGRPHAEPAGPGVGALLAPVRLRCRAADAVLLGHAQGTRQRRRGVLGVRRRGWRAGAGDWMGHGDAVPRELVDLHPPSRPHHAVGGMEVPVLLGRDRPGVGAIRHARPAVPHRRAHVQAAGRVRPAARRLPGTGHLHDHGVLHAQDPA